VVGWPRTEEFASATHSLLEDPVVAQAIGAAGVERVRERFLLPRLLLDGLDLFRTVTRSRTERLAPAARAVSPRPSP
jgi:hypothetical protein